MDKFSRIDKRQPKKEEETKQWEGKYLTMNKWKDYEFVSHNQDSIMVLPYLIDEGMFLLRREVVPSFQYRYKDTHDRRNNTHFLTCIAGGIEKNESIQNAIRRELFEEAGIVLHDLFEINYRGPFFLNKGNNSHAYVSILELRYNDYKQVRAPGDGTLNEKLSQTISVSVGDIDELLINDVPTELLLEKFRREYKL